MFFDYGDMGAAKKVRRRKGPLVPSEMLGLPERLERAMRDRGLDQPKLAKRAGVSQAAVSKLVTGGSLHGATAVVVARIAIALEVPSGWLLTADGDVIPRVLSRARSGAPLRLEEHRDPLVPPPPARQESDETHGRPL